MEFSELAEQLELPDDSPLRAPIEDHVRVLATEKEVSVIAVGACLVRMNEAAPLLRAPLAKAAEGQPLSDEDETLLLRGLYILGGARARRCWPIFVQLLRRPPDELDELLGDVVTEHLSSIASGLFEGDFESLIDIVRDRAIDEYVREQLLTAAAFLTFDGVIERSAMEALLERFDDEQFALPEDHTWYGWMLAIGLLGIRRMEPRVRKAWDDGRIPKDMMGWQDFEADLAAAEARPDDVERFRAMRLGYIEDAYDAMSWLSWTDDHEDAGEPNDYRDFGYVSEPVTNPWRGVGRNDPCPCGSGKKAKKCCMPN